jgi:hypothetical protein
VTGTLYFTLPAEEGCVPHTLALPGLEGANAFSLDRCEFDVSPRGDVLSGGPCPGTDIELRPLGGPPRHLRGCAPAWTPDGELTYVRDGDVLTLGGGTFVHDVARFARNALGSENLAVQQVAWLIETRLAARVTARGVQPSVVVVIEEGKAVSEPLFADRDAQIEISQATEEILVTFTGGGVQVFGRVSATPTRSAPRRRSPSRSRTALAVWPRTHRGVPNRCERARPGCRLLAA